MSDEDRQRWNARYQDGAYETIIHPSVFLESHAHLLPKGRTLDLACGAGRNALFLAGLGHDVDAVDISSVALTRGKQRAEAEGLAINWIEADLESGFEAAERYDLIVNIRYVYLDLLRSLIPTLNTGGVLLVEQHLAWPQDNVELIGPKNAAFRVQPGALEQITQGMEVLHAEEGLFKDPSGETAALARIIARCR